jgi:predicted aspartyl protease
MGFVHVKVAVENLQGSIRRELDLLVDTGALYSIVPAVVLRELGITPRQRLEFELANGQVIERDVGEARFYYDGRNAASTVIFGEENDAGILGVVTLENMGLDVEPRSGRIRPARMILY